MKRRPTVYDVADLAGVSIATVSRYFRRPDDVRPDTKKAVADAVAQLGYVPSGAARGLAAGRTETIGLALPNFDDLDDPGPIPTGSGISVVTEESHQGRRVLDLYFSEVLRGTEVEAWRRNLAVTIYLGRAQTTGRTLDALVGKVDGLVVLAGVATEAELAEILRRTPVVVVGGEPNETGFDHVGIDNAAAMAALVDHLVDVHDVRSPVLIAGPADSPDSIRRAAGYAAAIGRAGLDISAHPFAHSDFTRPSGREIARQVFAERALPDAIVCANDQTALGVLDVALQRGIDVPGQVIVTGFDGIDDGRLATPSITTVEQPMLDLGRAAVDTLVERLDNPSTPPMIRTLPVRLILRASCGCVSMST